MDETLLTPGSDGPRPSCGFCGDLLGVYEPLVLDDGGAGGPVRTSLLRLAREAHPVPHGTLFHVDCHADAIRSFPRR